MEHRETLLEKDLGNGVTLWVEARYENGRIFAIESRILRNDVAEDCFEVEPEAIAEFQPEECCPNCGWADPLLGADNGNCRNEKCGVWLEEEDGELTDNPKEKSK